MTITVEEALQRRTPKAGWNKAIDVQRAQSMLTLISEIEFDPPSEEKCFKWLFELGLDIDEAMHRIRSRWADVSQEAANDIRIRLIRFYCAQKKRAGKASVPDGEPHRALKSSKEFVGIPLEVQRATDIEIEPIEWLWPDRLPLGKFSLIAGFPDQGKSQVMLKIAAAITTGDDWPDGSGKAAQGVVIIVSSEDTAKNTIVPRFLAAGGKRESLLIVKPVIREVVKSQQTIRVMNIADDLKHLRSIVDREAQSGRIVRMIGFDPLNAYFGGPLKADSHKNSDMRALLTPISEWAEDLKIACLGIMHFNKGGNGHTLYRVTDSLAISASARAAWFCVKDAEAGEFLMVQAKNNLSRGATGLTYTIEDRDLGEKGMRAPYIAWGGPTTKTADEALTPVRREREPEAVNTAIRFLQQELANGPSTKAQLEDARKAASVSEMTWRRAREQLGVVSIRPEEVGGVWHFRLPEPADDFDDAGEPDFG